MKPKKASAPKPSSDLRVYFIAFVFAILGAAVGGSALITFLLNTFVLPTLDIPAFVWILLFSIVLSGAITSYFSKWILLPITRLSAAMREVTEGDFGVRVQSSTHIRELKDTYENFNLMAKGLGATETLQSDFVSNVSHEFKTPINAIEGYAMLLQDQGQTGEEQGEYLEKILFNTRRLSELVGNILLLSRIDNQAIQTQKTEFRLDEQIRAAILSLERKWSEKEAEFDVELEPILYRGSEGLLMHVWVNLIDNAVKFIPQGGTIAIRLKAEQSFVVCTVSDDGPGVPEEARAQIFERFYQADSSHEAEGNGLGLALVKRIVDVSGGMVEAKSAPDCGASFIVTLPMA